MKVIIINILLVIAYIIVNTIIYIIEVIIRYLCELEYSIVNAFAKNHFIYHIAVYSNFISKVRTSIRYFYDGALIRHNVFNTWDIKYLFIRFIEDVKFYYEEDFERQR